MRVKCRHVEQFSEFGRVQQTTQRFTERPYLFATKSITFGEELAFGGQTSAHRKLSATHRKGFTIANLLKILCLFLSASLSWLTKKWLDPKSQVETYHPKIKTNGLKLMKV
ncbi:hypothetical protein H5410_036371 [Solanum commersonii]|uniref:Uncharacterized protein n=1 Tax=Solanum commersonii TaxID=4109 RepID=A0A9J5Y3C8_SOLCO|nr:hypothetical protein H5410_036371 [Solanum commersonii]